MRSNFFPLDILGQALVSVIGWTLAVLALSDVGLWLGCWLGGADIWEASLNPIGVLVAATIGCFWSPWVILADVVTVLCWCVPLGVEYEGTRVHVYLGLLMLAMWGALGFSMLRG